jgi:hypothetical protein
MAQSEFLRATVCLKTPIFGGPLLRDEVHLLVAIIKKHLKIDLSRYTFLQILSVTLFEKAPLFQVLRDFSATSNQIDSANQLNLFN